VSVSTWTSSPGGHRVCPAPDRATPPSQAAPSVHTGHSSHRGACRAARRHQSRAVEPLPHNDSRSPVWSQWTPRLPVHCDQTPQPHITFSLHSKDFPAMRNDDNADGLPIVPSPRDPASHDEPRTSDETKPAELVPVDQPATDPPIPWRIGGLCGASSDHRVVAAVLDRLLCDRASRRGVLSARQRLSHRATTPVRRDAAAAVSGRARRLLRALLRWLVDAEGHHLRVLTASGDNAADYLKLTRQRDHRVKTRGIIALVVAHSLRCLCSLESPCCPVGCLPCAWCVWPG